MQASKMTLGRANVLEKADIMQASKMTLVSANVLEKAFNQYIGHFLF